jgi:thiosulfate/3-mercaptopyruvate sulfurtransferase
VYESENHIEKGVFMIRLIAALVVAALAPMGQARAAEWQKLLTPQGLATLAAAGPVRILDIRPAQGGGPSYAGGHVPGAVSAPYASWRGPAENPGAPLSDAALTERLRSAGIDLATAVVVVHQGADQSDFGAAARVYWTLKSAGVARIAILNGGHAAWAAAGLPVSTEPVVPARTTVTATLSPQWTATVEEVRAASEGTGRAVLVDARPEAFFRGQQKHDAAAAGGTLRGAVNLVHERWFAPQQTAISAPEPAIGRARELAAEANGAPIVSFCNTGHWAATNWFALSEIAGLDNVKLYPESMVGYTRRGLPVVAGN